MSVTAIRSYLAQVHLIHAGVKASNFLSFAVVTSILTAWLFYTHWCNIRQCFILSGKQQDQDDGSN